MPSQWALQYFPLSVGMQLQAAFAHFLVLAIVLSFAGPLGAGPNRLHGITMLEVRQRIVAQIGILCPE
jgi:hypothetical protein